MQHFKNYVETSISLHQGITMMYQIYKELQIKEAEAEDEVKLL